MPNEEHVKWYSHRMGRDMDVLVHGHAGAPVIICPSSWGHYYEWKDFLMVETLADKLDAGHIQLFGIDSHCADSWYNDQIPPRERVRRHNVWEDYVLSEVVPFIWNSCRGRVGIITAGASLGAFHCANQLFRRPDLFEGMIAMSGSYDIRGYYDGDYYDDNVYYNNPVDYLPNLGGHDLWLLQQKRHIHIVTGQGDYENPDASRRLAGILYNKGITYELDLWGYDMPHDWPTWRAMLRYYLSEKF